MLKYRVIRYSKDNLDGEVIADNLTDTEFVDTEAEGGSTYSYEIEAYTERNVYQDRKTDYLEVPIKPFGHVFESNRSLAWNDLPTQDADNGTLTLLGTETRQGVPFVVETGETIATTDVDGSEVVVPAVEIEHRTASVFKYCADFVWDNSGNPSKKLDWMTDVTEFKDNQIASGVSAFENISVTELTALPDLDTSNLTNMTKMFSGALAFNQSLDTFDTRNVEDMSYMFSGAQKFNQPLNHFDTSKVTSMMMTFGTSLEFNQPLNNWDTSKVTSMSWLFNMAKAFNQDISMWCVSQIGSKPSYFDKDSGFSDQTDKQPKWGQPC